MLHPKGQAPKQAPPGAVLGAMAKKRENQKIKKTKKLILLQEILFFSA